jgi:hypothetical protein
MMADPFNFVGGFLIQFYILSLIFFEAYGWGWYNYTEATVYTSYVNESVENPEGKWTDFCDTDGNYCLGLFCDDTEYLNRNGECETSITRIKT